MSDLLEAVAVAKDIKYATCSKFLIGNKHTRILKSKENLLKPKCNKELKKKLKKYKLRRGGNEDQDVLDVSQILVTSLRIKSPNKLDKTNNKYNKVDCEHTKPNNYLFKMVRRKKTCTQIETNNTDVNTSLNVNNTCTLLSDEDSQNSKQMDAFKLMMDSRNKSIGTNSPGKEKTEETLSQDILEKKAIKAKRVLSLQKMAENKGSLKHKEIEEFREKCIKKKMLKRAQLFKDMIIKQDTKKEHLSQSKITNTSTETNPNKDIINQSNDLKQNNTTLKLCDIFSDTNTVINETKPLKRVSDEDIEFLKKLSPSIRKKENMLCYFKTVTKDTELSSEEFKDNCSDESTKSVIKVKFTSKQRKKGKILKPCEDDVGGMSDTKSIQKNRDSKEFRDNSEQMEYNENRKRKRDKKIKDRIPNITLENKDNIELCNNENRPKRNTKKPVKYTEDVHCFSSDEELQIFTPKKKRNSENCSKAKSINSTIHEEEECKNIKKDIPLKCNDKGSLIHNKSKLSNDTIVNQKHKVKSELKKNLKSVNGTNKNLSSIKENNHKKTVKLAPIFVSKPQLSQEAIEAKKRFLKSGVPEKLKKNIIQQTNSNTLLDNFHSVFHIHQNGSYFDNFQGKDWFKFKSSGIEEINIADNYSFKLFIMKPLSAENHCLPTLQVKPEKVLKTIKSTYPRFPVYRTYQKLRCRCKGEFKDINYSDLDNSVEIIDSSLDVNNENPEKLNWCDKYKPTSSNEIIGNFESIKELKRWLETWSEKLTKEKINSSDMSDMSDFYSSDIDSRDSMKTTNNILIVTGQTGSGKTSSVYAVAAELAIKVIEVNASSKRNGKIMLQDLQEATQSHKVNRAKSSTECSQKSSTQELPNLLKNKKRGRPKRAHNDSNTNKIVSTITPETLTQASSSQEYVRTGMSLILIDDADIVFDQDDGFCSAISQLIQFSKRPVILVTSSPSCPHLQKFIQNGKIIHLRPLLPRMLGTWLDIMCLADVGKCYIGLGEKLLDFYRGDIRKTINCLQFYMNSYKNTNPIDEVISQVKCNIDDENSGMSWADSESLEGTSVNEISLYCSIDKQFNLFSCNVSPNVFNIWWNLSSHLNNKKNKDNVVSHLKVEQGSELKKIVETLDTLSIIDSIDLFKPDNRSNITSKPWYSSESASLLESEDFDGYNEAHCINKEISNVLMMSTILELEKNFKTENGVNCLAPSMSIHRERDRIVSRHHTLSSYLNASAVLDRRAIACDYWSSCRTISRIEKSKTDYNTKRNNRFCHYLKSLNILCKNDFFDNLAESLT
ncbi:unnamed protein product [Euphydryas editha]|uniref:AAA+ ATPase domain-containing protein n=1 Tax=Euphydryas editha TaxID=104508 RepID=A0AAU9U096_EUPED|nr:unnamed protein product [Euphydryas editha]